MRHPRLYRHSNSINYCTSFWIHLKPDSGALASCRSCCSHLLHTGSANVTFAHKHKNDNRQYQILVVVDTCKITELLTYEVGDTSCTRSPSASWKDEKLIFRACCPPCIADGPQETNPAVAYCLSELKTCIFNTKRTMCVPLGSSYHTSTYLGCQTCVITLHSQGSIRIQ